MGTVIPLPDLIIYAVRSIAFSLPLYWAVAMVFFFFAIATRKAAMTMGISVACSILGIVFTNKACFSAPRPSESPIRFLPTVQIPMIYEKAPLTAFPQRYGAVVIFLIVT